MLAALSWASACGDGKVEPPENGAPLTSGTIPAQTVEVGQTAVVDVSPYFSDPDGDTLIVRRIPEAGRVGVDVMAVPTFDVTAIPFLWTQEPDSAMRCVWNTCSCRALDRGAG